MLPDRVRSRAPRTPDEDQWHSPPANSVRRDIAADSDPMTSTPPTTLTTPPRTADLLRVQQQCEISDYALWLAALPLGTDFLSVGYHEGHDVYRQVRARRDQFDSAAAMVSHLVSTGHRDGDEYRDLSHVRERRDLLRVRDDGVVKTVSGVKLLWHTECDITADVQLPDEVVVAIVDQLAAGGFDATVCVGEVDGCPWLSSPVDGGAQIRLYPAQSAPLDRADRRARLWAQRVAASVAADIVRLDVAGLRATLHTDGVWLRVTAVVNADGRIHTATPTRWVFDPVPEVLIPSGWHGLGIAHVRGRIYPLIQHSATGICAVVLDYDDEAQNDQ